MYIRSSVGGRRIETIPLISQYFLSDQWLLACSLPMRDYLQILLTWTTRKLLSVTAKIVYSRLQKGWRSDFGNFENKQNTTDPKLGFDSVSMVSAPSYYLIIFNIRYMKYLRVIHHVNLCEKYII
jgi:hypothetical protein